VAESAPESRVTLPADEMPANYAWNFAAFVMDSSLFTVGMSFLGTTTILPALIARLTSSPVAVGLASGVVSGAWLLPQLLIASAVSGLRRKKPVVVGAAWISRLTFFLLGWIVWKYALSAPQATYIGLIVGLGVFYAIDAVVSVPWFDLLAKAIPPRRRGRVIGTSQVLGGLGGMAAGVAVRYVLSDQSPWAFPQNHAVLLIATSAVLMVSAIGLTLLREPEGKQPDGPVPSFGQVLRGVPRLLAGDRPFSRLVIVRILAGATAVANTFYVLHATQVGGLTLSDTGLLVTAQVTGSLASGLLMTYAQDRLGPLVHIRIVVGLAAVPPLLLLALGPLLPSWGGAALSIYIALFFLLGITISSLGWPFFNYILEYAPEPHRPLYIGTINTLAALVMAAPPLGGWLLRTCSYPVLFAVALALAVAALAISARLPSTRTANA